MRVTSRNPLFFLLCALSLAGSSALAQDSSDDRPRPPRQGEGENQPHRKPPEAAFKACDDLEENDVCEVELKDRTIEGHCLQAREESRLVCVPERPDAPPPAEAESACANKNAGDSCSVTGRNGEALPEGVCATGAHGLHCRPAKPPSEP